MPSSNVQVLRPRGAYRHPDARILVFAKAPRAGTVKTRLIPALGPEGAAALHRLLTTHTVATLSRSRLAPLTLCVTPDVDDDFLRALARRAGMALEAQVDGDLGRRMAAALRRAQTESEQVLLVGTDCPNLDELYLGAALAALESGVDVVLGPAEDGGYVLIGLSRPVDERLFKDIDWGTDRVLEQTRARLAALGWSHRELPTRWDVDRPEDLARLWS